MDFKNILLLFSLVAVAAAASSSEEIENELEPTKYNKAKSSGTSKDREILRQKLFSDYDTHNLPDHANATLGLALIHLDVVEEKSVLDLLTWVRMTWKDHRLTWDAEENGVEILRVGAEEVWKPDLVLYNNAKVTKMMDCFDTQVLIYPDGSVLWVPPCRLQALCDFDVVSDPSSEHSCTLKFGSWTVDGLTMDLNLYGGKKAMDTSELVDTSNWKLTENDAKRHVKTYDCCVEPYISLTFELGFQRK